MAGFFFIHAFCKQHFYFAGKQRSFGVLNRSSENVSTRLSEILDLEGFDSIQVVDCSVQRTSGMYVFESSFSIIRCFEFSSRTSVFNFISTGTSGGIPSYLRFTAFISIFIGIYMRTLSRYTI